MIGYDFSEYYYESVPKSKEDINKREKRAFSGKDPQFNEAIRFFKSIGINVNRDFVTHRPNDFIKMYKKYKNADPETIKKKVPNEIEKFTFKVKNTGERKLFNSAVDEYHAAERNNKRNFKKDLNEYGKKTYGYPLKIVGSHGSDKEVRKMIDKRNEVSRKNREELDKKTGGRTTDRGKEGSEIAGWWEEKKLGKHYDDKTMRGDKYSHRYKHWSTKNVYRPEYGKGGNESTHAHKIDRKESSKNAKKWRAGIDDALFKKK